MSNLALNPFFAPFPVEQNTREEYAIVRRADVSAPEVDRADADVLEVTVRWGRTVLGVAHLPVDGSLKVGEGEGATLAIPEEILGAMTATIVDKGALVVPAKASCDRTNTGALAKGERAKITFGEGAQAITVHVARVAAARSTPRRGTMKKGLLGALAGAFLAHGLAIAAFAFAPAPSLAGDDAPIDKDTVAYLLQEQRVIAMNEIPTGDETATDGANEGKGGEMGAQHKGDQGQSGSLDAPNKNAAYALKGPPESKEEHLARLRNEIDSGNYLALGALTKVFGAANHGPIDAASAWDQEAGHDPFSANGHLSGDDLGDAYGYNGLGVTGPGLGGGGAWDGLGLNKVGGFGYDNGTCPAGQTCTSFGNPGGKIQGTHNVGTPKVLPVGAEINGLPPEVVQRMVHANFPRFFQCYDHASKSDPSLEGVVTTTFIIDETGAVETAQVVKGLNPALNECVAGVFNTISFPIPDGSTFGKAHVTYSINFGHQ